MTKKAKAAPEENSGISAITVEGFKSIRKPTEIAIKPLTILAGANSSGKSSIMQPLLLMKQTLEAPSDPGVFLLDGPNVRFTSAQQVVSRFGKKSDPWVVIRFRTISDRTMGVSYRKFPKSGFDINAMTETNQLGFGDTWRPGTLKTLGDGHAMAVRERCFLGLHRLHDKEDPTSPLL